MIQEGNSWTWSEQSKSASEPTAPAAGNQGYTDDVSPRWNGLLAWRGVDQREVQAGEVMGGRGAFGRAASARWGSSVREVGRDNLGKNWGTRSVTGSEIPVAGDCGHRVEPDPFSPKVRTNLLWLWILRWGKDRRQQISPIVRFPSGYDVECLPKRKETRLS
jgi:hypothetical protein